MNCVYSSAFRDALIAGPHSEPAQLQFVECRRFTLRSVQLNGISTQDSSEETNNQLWSETGDTSDAPAGASDVSSARGATTLIVRFDWRETVARETLRQLALSSTL